MKWSSQPRVALEVAAVRACMPEATLQLESLAARVEMLEKKIEAGVVAVPAPAPDAPGESKKLSESAAAVKHKKTEESAATRPAAVAEAAAQTSEALWEKAKALLRQEPQLFAPIAQGKYGGLDGDTVRVIFSKGGEVFCNMLRQETRREQVEAILSKAAGRPLKLAVEMETAVKAGDAAKSKDMLQQAFDVFGRENVQVVDDPPDGHGVTSAPAARQEESPVSRGPSG